MNKRSEQPFEVLGNKLRTIREKLHESLAEVSGAVEIDEDYLQQIERGADRPSEDILMLLISHFDMGEEEAARLWKLAGYDYEALKDDEAGEADDMGHSHNHPMMMVLALDQRVMYSDGAEINANKQGLVLTFTQSNGNSVLPISKVGMSYDQARRVLDILQKTLDEAERRKQPRQLPEQTESNQT